MGATYRSRYQKSKDEVEQLWAQLGVARAAKQGPAYTRLFRARDLVEEDLTN